MGWICGDGGTEKAKIGQKEVGGMDMRGMEVQKNQTKIGQKEVGGVDMRGWRYRKKPKIGQKEVGGVDMRGWRYRKIKNQNRTEGSGWCGYAGMEVQKNPK